MSFKKISILFLAVLLCISIGLNWNYNEKESGDTAKLLGKAAYVSSNLEVEENDYESQKIKCEIAREKALALLEEVLQNPASDKKQYDEAQAKKLAIASAIEAEALSCVQLESKGYADAVVYITADGASVYLPDTELSAVQVLQIQEIVASTANLLPEKIKIALYS